MLQIHQLCAPNSISNKTPRFALKGRYHAKVVDVYDGDTCQIVLWVGMCLGGLTNYVGVRRFTLRIEGIDAPEMKDDSEEVRRRAVVARDYLRQLILDRNVVVVLKGTEKYGRLLGRIEVYRTAMCFTGCCLDDMCRSLCCSSKLDVSQEMIDEGHAKAYDGGRRV